MGKEGEERRGEGGTAPLTRPPTDPWTTPELGPGRLQKVAIQGPGSGLLLVLDHPSHSKTFPLHNDQTHQMMSE